MHRIACRSHSFMMIIVLFSCIVFFNGVVQASLFTPCHQSDQECMVASANAALPLLAAGVPEFGINSLDPVPIGTVKDNNTGLYVELSNTIVRGLKKCTVLGLRRSDLKLDLEIKCSLILTGDYVLKGKLIIMPIEGVGQYRIKIRDIVVKIHVDLGEKMRRGEKHWVIQGWKHTANVKGSVNFLFKNLFNGKEDLSVPVHEFANQNWLIIFNDIGGPVVREVVAQMLSEVVKIFHHVPVNDISLD